MGKLADLKDQRNEMSWDHPNRENIEKKINNIEQWCIDNKKGYITKLTTWNKGQKKWRAFGFYEDEFEQIGQIIVEIKKDKVITAHYRCGTCGTEVLHFVLYNYCIKCNTKDIVVHVS